jgi:HSP20 family protein
MTNHGKSAVRRTDNESAVDVKSHPTANVLLPSADVLETSDAYLLMLDMPGAAKEGISVAMEGESLTVRGSTEDLQAKDVEFVFSEIRSGTYQREFTLGRDLDRENIEATYEDGVLTLRLPKKESMKPREITIR